LHTTREIAALLIDLHHKGVVHRDLKPANLLRHTDGRLLLNDLGLGATMGLGAFVMANGFRGTPAYAAPEQHANFVVFASDIYALGIILHELVTGSRDLRGNLAPARLMPLIASFTHPNYQHRPSAYDACLALDIAMGNEAQGLAA